MARLDYLSSEFAVAQNTGSALAAVMDRHQDADRGLNFYQESYLTGAFVFRHEHSIAGRAVLTRSKRARPPDIPASRTSYLVLEA